MEKIYNYEKCNYIFSENNYNIFRKCFCLLPLQEFLEK